MGTEIILESMRLLRYSCFSTWLMTFTSVMCNRLTPFMLDVKVEMELTLVVLILYWNKVKFIIISSNYFCSYEVTLVSV